MGTRALPESIPRRLRATAALRYILYDDPVVSRNSRENPKKEQNRAYLRKLVFIRGFPRIYCFIHEHPGFP